MSAKEQLLRTWENEVATTLKVLPAYPPAKVDLKPHGKARAAKDPARTLVFEGTAGPAGAGAAVDGGSPPSWPPPPKGGGGNGGGAPGLGAKRGIEGGGATR